ncbi:PREDICTED: uncharacterized protein LOC109186611 isoform X2 [Ipomoea nil]|uniref:uncharacterized protein LOC109186611 isoform X2 n=1 Tax=Ipomoea nil TaxID=35883 RepID=UPI000900C996|nr:PREDICTED: uncharacterized protein LOC109186611 isoform X2 [Ipomoea nil]
MAGKQTEFWLPPEFLTGDDMLMDPYYFESSAAKSVSRSNLLFPSEFSRDLCPSPVDSGENESDEEDLLTGLTRRFCRTFIEEADKSARSLHHLEKGFVLSRSPQSTLAHVGSCTGRSSGSSNGSPNGPSLVSSPPTTPLGAENDAWDLFFQDVGHVNRLKMTAGDGSTAKNRCLPDLPPAKLVNNTVSGVRISPFHQARGSQMMPHQSSEMWGQKVSPGWLGARQLYQTRVGSGFAENGCRGRTVLGGSAQSAALHSLQLLQQNRHGGPGTRGVFPGGSGGGGMKRECSGTGVFIPRRYGGNTTKPPSDSRKTTGRSGSAALHSTKAVSGVNRSLNSFEGFNGLAQPQMNPLDLLIARRNGALLAQRMRNMTPDVSISPELRLPPEWTY